MLCDGWHHQAQVSSLSCIFPITVATQPRHAGLVGPSLVFYHWPMARWWWKNFQLRLQCTGRKTSSLCAAPEQSCCWPAEISWMQLLAPYETVELRSAPWKHNTCADGALQFGLILPLCVGEHSPVPAATCRSQGKRSSCSNNMEWRAGERHVENVKDIYVKGRCENYRKSQITKKSEYFKQPN